MCGLSVETKGLNDLENVGRYLLIRLVYGIYGWEEVLEALSVDKREMHPTEIPGKWVFDRLFDTLPGATNSLFFATVEDEKLDTEPCRTRLARAI